jgi:hypothetical protein
LGGATVALDGFAPITTSSAGTFQLPVPATSSRVQIFLSGYITRTSYLQGGVVRDVGDVSLISTAPPFDMTLFLQIIRGTIGGVSPNYPNRIFRVTVPEQLLVIVDRTIDAGALVDESTLSRTVDIVREFWPLWTGGKIRISGVRRLSVRPDGIQAQLNNYFPVSFYSGGVPFGERTVCGTGGSNPTSGSINISLTACGDLRTQLPGVIAHELGHALPGLSHVDPAMYPGLAMNTIHQSLRPTTAELYYANIAMNRPHGNVHPDNDCGYLGLDGSSFSVSDRAIAPGCFSATPTSILAQPHRRLR